MSVRVLESLDEVLGVGADALVEKARRQGLLNGVAVGLVRDGECFVRLFGEGIGLQSRFEVGSVTKIYTAELLAILVERGVVRLDDPVAKYLPGVAAGDMGEDAITLEDLATHWSGLPRLPPLRPRSPTDPYAQYGARELEQFLAGYGLRRTLDRGFLYSNLGYSVLGYVLGQAAGTTYAELLKQAILEPLGLAETALAIGQPQPSLVHGHDKSGSPVPHWNFDICAPCGGLCSTARDQARWLTWLLEDTERLSFKARAVSTGGSIGLGWIIPPRGDVCWHNGATAGFSSWISLDRTRREGVTVLSNRQIIGLIDKLGGRLQRCLAGGEPDEL